MERGGAWRVVVVVVVCMAGCKRSNRKAVAPPDAGPGAGASARPVDAGADGALAAVVDAAVQADAELPGVIIATPTMGPFTTPDALCAELLAKLEADDRASATCERDKDFAPKAPAPYQALQSFRFEDANEEDTRYLLFQLDQQWFAIAAGSWANEGMSGGDVTLGQPTTRDVVPGDPPELVFDSTELNSNADDFDNDRFTEITRTFVCKRGASTHPSCAFFLSAGRGANSSPEDRMKYRFQLSCPFLPDGRVDCKVRGKWPDQANLDRSELEQTFTLRFR